MSVGGSAPVGEKHNPPVEGGSHNALNQVAEVEIHSELVVAALVLIHQQTLADAYDLRTQQQQVQFHPPRPKEAVFSPYARWAQELLEPLDCKPWAQN